MVDMNQLRRIADEQMDVMQETGAGPDELDLAYVEVDGQCIINPWLSPCGRFEVDPEATYGEGFQQWIAECHQQYDLRSN